MKTLHRAHGAPPRRRPPGTAWGEASARVIRQPLQRRRACRGVEADPAVRDARANYHFLTSAVAPRPIAWVTTADPGSGLVNAAPFSWFNAVCSEPPMLMLAIQQRPDGSPKDTLRNLLATGEFVVNVAPRGAAEAMVQSSGDYPPDVSEVERLGLATVPSRKVGPPRLAASPVHFECRLRQAIPLGVGKTTLVLGEVVHLAADDAVLDERGNVDPAKVVLVGRIGGSAYVDTSAPFTMRRPAGQGDAVRTGELPGAG